MLDPLPGGFLLSLFHYLIINSINLMNNKINM